jgi:PEP-CTERM motif-containing protein
MKHSLVAAIAVLGFTTSASANLVTNGSFETFTGTFGGDGGAQLVPGSTTLTGWTVEGGEIAVLKTPNIYNLTAADGVNFMDLTGYTNTGFPKGVSQSLSGLAVGSTYAFSMELGIRNGACVSGGNNCHGPIQASASIGATSQIFTEDSNAPGNNWGTFGFNFIATTPTMALTILGRNVPAGNEFLGLDDVSVNLAAVPGPMPVPGTTAVPEPETYILMVAGLGITGLIARRCKTA